MIETKGINVNLMDAKQKRIQCIVKALEKNGAINQTCSRCNNNQFQFVGETLLSLQKEPNVMTLGGPAIPVAIVACSKCGNIWQYAIGLLNIGI